MTKKTLEIEGPAAVSFLPKDRQAMFLRKNADKAHEVFAGVFTDDQRMLGLYAYLRDRIEKEVTVDETLEGSYRGTGITSNVWKLGSIQGYGFNPKGTNPYDATVGRKVKLFARTEQRMAWYYELTVPQGPVVPQVLTINRHTSLGMPKYAKSEEDKAVVIGKYLRSIDDIAELTARGDLETLRTKHDVIFCYAAGERQQPQTINKLANGSYLAKPRKVTDFFGRQVDVDSSLGDAIRGAPPVAKRTRSRVINVSTMALFPCRVLSEFWASARKARFPSTFKHTEPSEYVRRLRRFRSFLAVDVANHDWNVPIALIRACSLELERKLGPSWALSYLAGIRMPQITRNDYLGASGVRRRGDLDDFAGFTAWPVNPSGHPCTSITAGDAGTFYMADALMEAGEAPDSIEGMRALLAGENRNWAFINGGDNNLIGGPSTSDIASIIESVPYVTIEESDSFLGSILYRGDAGLSLVPDIAGYINNLVMPGRSLNDPMKGDPIAGAYERRKFYMASPSFKQMDEILCSGLSKFLGIDYANLPAAESAVGRSYNMAEHFFINDPESIHWKVDKHSIPESLLGRYYLSYGTEQTVGLVDAFNNSVRASGFSNGLRALLE